MIVVDIETSGVDIGKCGIWQIGAVELENPSNVFLEEARVGDKDKFKLEGTSAIELFGKTEKELRGICETKFSTKIANSSEENFKNSSEKNGKSELFKIPLRDRKKQSEKQLLENFLKWCEKIKVKNFICQNPHFDFAFIETKAFKYGLKFEIPHRVFDLHSVAQMKYFSMKRKFLFKNFNSDMGLKNILKFVGMRDTRKEHNALEDAQLTAECFSRIVSGKKLIKEFSEFEIPKYLR